MTTRTASPLAGIGWLRKAINLGGRNPKTLLAAAAMILGVSLVPSLVTLPLQFLYPNNLPVFVGVMAFSIVVGLLLSPVFAGFLQVIDAIEQGRPARARDVFAPYGNGTAKPVIGFSLLMWVVYAALFGVVLLVAGPEMRELWMNAMQHPGQAQPVPALPPGFWRIMGVITVSWILIGGLYAIAVGQIAIARQRVLPSFADGVLGTLKNLPAILVLLVLMFLLGLAALVVFLILAVLIGLVVAVAGEWLAVVLLVPLYAILLLASYIVMFGLAYNFWRDVCGGAAPATFAVTEA